MLGSVVKKPKHREEVERLIHRGYRLGVCDIDGNTIETKDGRMVAKPRSRGVVRFYKRYSRRMYEDC